MPIYRSGKTDTKRNWNQISVVSILATPLGVFLGLVGIIK